MAERTAVRRLVLFGSQASASFSQFMLSSMSRKIVIGCDHAGFVLKTVVIDHLKSKGFELVDVGCYDVSSVDYPDVAGTLCKKVVDGETDTGILVCGSGIGMSIAANKIHGIRAALLHDHYGAVMSRQHNNANVLCLGERTTGTEVAKEIVDTFLSTPFAGGKHQVRVEKIAKMEC